jgi:hypothetical protein
MLQIATNENRLVSAWRIGGLILIYIILTLPSPAEVFTGERYIDDNAVSRHSAAGDFDNDGIPDLAVIYGDDSNQLHILHGFGNGNFAKMGSKNVGSLITNDVAAADFNADGKLDVVVVHGGINFNDNNKVSVFLGNGDGTLQNEVEYNYAGSGTFTTTVVTGDFDNDGDIDIAMGYYNDFFQSSVTVMLNNGSGAFPGAWTTGNIGGVMRQLVKGDFNMDGKLDLAVAQGNPVVLYGTGIGTFNTPVALTATGGRAVAAGDFNGDGKPDLAFSLGSAPTSTVNIYLNSGSGITTTPAYSYTLGVEGTSIAAADFNKDGKLDLIVTDNVITGQIRLSHGNGNGSFPTFASIDVDGLPLNFTLGDFDTNNTTDVIINSESSAGGAIMLNSQNSARWFGDFDADLKTDAAIYRPSSSRAGSADWWVLPSGGASNYTEHFGLNTDKITPANYDNDNITDMSLFRESTGVWYILNSTTATVTTRTLGQTGDLPVPADYNNEGRALSAVYRPTTGVWYYLPSGSVTPISFSYLGTSGDKPVPADYDGDGRTDFAVFRAATGFWYIYQSSTGSTVSYNFGLSGDRPVQGDYDGDGKTDIAVYRPGNGVWYVQKSSDSQVLYATWGLSTDIPCPGDFTGDNRNDFVLFRPSTGTWYVMNSATSAYSYISFGTNGDIPVPYAYVP